MAAGSEDARRTRAEARADLIRRLFAVAISVGFAATLARMTWVQNGALPGPAELNQTLILGTALLAAVLGWESHLLAMAEKPLFGFSRFLVNPRAGLHLHVSVDGVGSSRMHAVDARRGFRPVCRVGRPHHAGQIASYDPALEGAPGATAAQIWNVYAGGFADSAQVSRGPAITLVWAGYFVLLAVVVDGRAYAHIRTTCVFALIGLVGFWMDATFRIEHRPGGGSMRRRILFVLIALIAAGVYFRFQSEV